MKSTFDTARLAWLLPLAMPLLGAGCEEKTLPPAVVQGELPLPGQHELEAKKNELEDLIRKANAGDATAQYTLGEAYQTGSLVTKNETSAFEWYLKAAAQGLDQAQCAVGEAFLNGEGAPKDYTKAAEWFNKSAARGNAKAKYSLAVMYNKGLGVKKNDAAALDWYAKAAEQDYAPAQFAYGQFFLYGLVVRKDAGKAFEWIQKAADKGDASAQNNLGVMYQQGVGIQKDSVKAVEQFRKSAEQGNAQAQYNLANKYFLGQGVPKDDSKAFEWYLKAAISGYAPAQTTLGMVYFLGRGTQPDLVLAYAWTNIAASAGDADGVTQRDQFDHTMFPDVISEAQRLSSDWKKGTSLVRGKNSSTAVNDQQTASDALRKTGTGTVFVVDKEGHGITNQHVISGCKELRVQGHDVAAKLVSEDAVNDLALVRLGQSIKDTATISSDSGKLRQGEDIVVFGFPLNSVLSSGGNLTPGVVSAVTGLGNNTNQFQLTAPIQPGSSGSPVLNKKGEVVGVVSMKLDDMKMAKATGQVGQNINFAVSGQTLKTFLDTQKVAYSTGSFFSWEKSTADLADEARKWTQVVECWR